MVSDQCLSGIYNFYKDSPKVVELLSACNYTPMQRRLANCLHNLRVARQMHLKVLLTKKLLLKQL